MDITTLPNKQLAWHCAKALGTYLVGTRGYSYFCGIVLLHFIACKLRSIQIRCILHTWICENAILEVEALLAATIGISELWILVIGGTCMCCTYYGPLILANQCIH